MAMVFMTGCAGKEVKTRDTDSVVIAIGSEPETLDPTQGWGHGNYPIVQSTLIRYTSSLEFENDLATGYSVTEDGLEYTFTLRQDAHFTDGTPVTAEDVAFTLETAKNAQSAIDLTYLEKAEAEDTYTVRLTLNRPTSVFLNTLASIGIVPKHAYSSDYGRNPVGSGPYMLVEWKPQEQMIFKANPEYYGEKASIENVTIVFMSEDAALAAVKAGQVDVAYSNSALAGTKVEGYHVESVRSADNRGFTLPVEADTGKVSENGYPIGNNVTCHKEIRQAMAYALDREAIVQSALNGFGRPAYSENDGMPWNNPECEIQTDTDYARQLLEENGWKDSDGDGIVEKDGVKAQFTCLYPSGDLERQAIALAASQQIREIGIQIDVEGKSWDEITRNMFSCAVMMGWGSTSPNETYYLYTSSEAYKEDFYNPEGYADSVTDAYLEKAMESLTPSEANTYWQKVQWDGTTGTSMKGECPWVWIVNLDHVTYVRDGLSIGDQPLHGHGHGLPLIQNLETWKWEEA